MDWATLVAVSKTGSGSGTNSYKKCISKEVGVSFLLVALLEFLRDGHYSTCLVGKIFFF